MTDNTLSPQDAIALDGPQEQKQVIGGEMPLSEKRATIATFDRFGWNQNRGVATVLRAFRESASVQDAVFDWLREQPAA